MKIILSRKGFDSANGGIVSPIFEDGAMISFPIPSNDVDTYDSLYYNGVRYSQILHDLRYKGGLIISSPMGSSSLTSSNPIRQVMPSITGRPQSNVSCGESAMPGRILPGIFRKCSR